MIRLVLDTNVWLDWLVFDDPGVRPIALAVAAGTAEIVVDEAVEVELTRVLGYPFGNKTLAAQQQAECLERCRGLARRADGRGTKQPAVLPRCTDPDDQKFLELAAACNAAYLVTRDRALLDLARHRSLSFRILEPATLTPLLGSPRQ